MAFVHGQYFTSQKRQYFSSALSWNSHFSLKTWVMISEFLKSKSTFNPKKEVKYISWMLN